MLPSVIGPPRLKFTHIKISQIEASLQTNHQQVVLAHLVTSHKFFVCLHGEYQIKIYNFVETAGKFITTKLQICKLGSSLVLIVIISIDEEPSLWIDSFAIINLPVFPKKYIFYFNLLQVVNKFATSC